ncbi:MAG: hypothetical protein A3B96_01845 [Candidatus Spechtbacteria bacterium RIFCSPHIGHO2_02_FULL_43_15b]|nr:MAG: hypothetical protein A3B96_01845 [Candidatus Spechtbacteria bacterium RIFCSPHIGHO2_02_FULL_43_15b]
MNKLNVSKFSDILRSAGYKTTPPRVLLLELLDKAKSPMTIKEIMEKTGKEMDQATAYRALKKLEGAGLVSQIDFQHGHAHFELAATKEHHHHIVCVKCGKVEDFTHCDLEEFSKNISKKSRGFSSIKHHSLEFFGICKSCE